METNRIAEWRAFVVIIVIAGFDHLAAWQIVSLAVVPHLLYVVNTYKIPSRNEGK